MDSSLLLNIGLLVFLLLANGFFVAVEFMLVTIRRSRVQELVSDGNPMAKVVQGMQKDMDFAVAGAQLGITIASLALGWVAEEVTHALGERIGAVSKNSGWMFPPGVGIVSSFLFLSVLHVIIGEQVPKSWALRMPETIMTLLSLPFRIFCWLTFPVVFVMNWISTTLLHLMGIPKASETAHAIGSPEEYILLFEQSKQVGAIEEAEHDLLNRSLELKHHDVGYLMVPRNEIYWIDISKDEKDVVQSLIRSPHTRVILAEGELDQLVGYVNARAVMSSMLQGEHVDFREDAEHLLVLPETRNALLVLSDFQNSQTDIAVVLDEYGAVRGLVTINDIVATALGDVPSFWEEEPQFSQAAEGEWTMDGMLPIEEFQEIVAMKELPETRRPYYTLGGLVIHVLKNIPEEGETFDLGDYQFEVLEMDNYRVAQVRVRRLPKNWQKQVQDEAGGQREFPKAS